uniref:Uncharacterized protein n=1 Tax=Siphoviridae sp. cttFh17 TaxID=2826491 RepID=A0A8S5NJS1_9CAUD|nr:MAG TPA: hypothetical protein [Siphoviridae sp. cttFh17]
MVYPKIIFLLRCKNTVPYQRGYFYAGVYHYILYMELWELNRSF